MESVYIVQMTFSGVKNYVVGVFENLEDAEKVATDKMSILSFLSFNLTSLLYQFY